MTKSGIVGAQQYVVCIVYRVVYAVLRVGSMRGYSTHSTCT